MKKIAVLFSLVVAGLLVTAFINPTSHFSSDFEGVVTYSTVTEGGAGQKDREIVIYIKGNKSKTLIGSGNYTNTIITDMNKPHDFILLMDVNGKKYELRNDTAKKFPLPDIKYVDGTKTIEGYTCHKAELTIKIDDTTSMKEDVYYTEDISSGFSNREFRGLKGFPLEWVAAKRTTTAIKIEKKSLSDDEFNVPPGYKLVTQEEMVQDMMKK